MSQGDGKIKMKIPARASFWYIFAGAASKAVGIISTPIFTRLLSGEEYGGFALYMTLLGGGSVICSAFNSGSPLYKGLKENENEKEDYLRSALWVSIAVSIVICLLLFAFSPFLELNRIFYLPLAIQLLCDSVTAIFLSSERFYYRYRSVVAISLVNAILPAALSVFLLFTLKLGYSVRIYSLLAASLLTASYSLIRIGVRGGGKAFFRQAFLFSLPMLPHCVSTAINGQADKLIISSLMGAAALGKYSVVSSMGSALQFTVTAIGSALSPWIIRRLRSGEDEKISALVTPMVFGYCALGMCLIAISPEGLGILAPKEYFEAFPALLPIALSIPFYFISTVSTVKIVYDGRTRLSLIISSVGSALNIILNYTLIGRFGYLGAGLATLICQGAVCAMNTVFTSRGGAKGLVDLKKAVAYVLLYASVGTVIFYFQHDILARGFLLLIPAFILLFCFKKAKTLVIENDEKIDS